VYRDPDSGESHLQLRLLKDEIKGAPQVDTGPEGLTDAEEERLYDYYGHDYSGRENTFATMSRADEGYKTGWKDAWTTDRSHEGDVVAEETVTNEAVQKVEQPHTVRLRKYQQWTEQVPSSTERYEWRKRARGTPAHDPLAVVGAVAQLVERRPMAWRRSGVRLPSAPLVTSSVGDHPLRRASAELQAQAEELDFEEDEDQPFDPDPIEEDELDPSTQRSSWTGSSSAASCSLKSSTRCRSTRTSANFQLPHLRVDHPQRRRGMTALISRQAGKTETLAQHVRRADGAAAQAGALV
jgi:hypothetical protein